MAVVDLFSKRQKRLRGEVPDVYQYNDIPKHLRVQIIHIWNQALGNSSNSTVYSVYEFIHGILCKEYGLFSLAGDANCQGDLREFFLTCKEPEKALDVIELSFQTIDSPFVRDHDYQMLSSVEIKPNVAIEELNIRFREHGVGYQYESGQLIRIDSQFIHAEAVKPALVLLSDHLYQGANEEFLAAHEHYRHQNYKECLNECLKAFESIMKIICQKRGWAYNDRMTASQLIEVCLSNGLVPTFLQSEFQGLRASLESGIPTVRNRLGGHGQGTQAVAVPPHLASYLLHLTATTIVFLVNAEKALP